MRLCKDCPNRNTDKIANDFDSFFNQSLSNKCKDCHLKYAEELLENKRKNARYQLPKNDK